MFTETEAKTKYCPQQANSGSGEYPKCDASGCAAWRWAENRSPVMPTHIIAANPQAKTIEEAGPIPHYGTDGDWLFSPAVDEDDAFGFGSTPAGWGSSLARLKQYRRGFCGLAGKPGAI